MPKYTPTFLLLLLGGGFLVGCADNIGTQPDPRPTSPSVSYVQLPLGTPEEGLSSPHDPALQQEQRPLDTLIQNAASWREGRSRLEAMGKGNARAGSPESQMVALALLRLSDVLSTPQSAERDSVIWESLDALGAGNSPEALIVERALNAVQGQHPARARAVAHSVGAANREMFERGTHRCESCEASIRQVDPTVLAAKDAYFERLAEAGARLRAF